MSLYTDVRDALRRPMPRIPRRTIVMMTIVTVLVVAVVVFRQPLARIVNGIQLPNPAPVVSVAPVIVPSISTPSVTVVPIATQTATATHTPTATPTPTASPTPDPWILIRDAPNQNFWEEKYEIQRTLRQDMWPVLTGENLEMTKEINGQPVLIKGRLAVIPNPYQQGEILELLIPYRYEWGDGLSSDVWIFQNNVNKGVDYFLQLPKGEQVNVLVTITSFEKIAECSFGTRCGWLYDIAGLSSDFFLKGVALDGPVIVSPVTIEVK